MIIIISVTISFTTCGLGMRIRLHFEQRQHLLFLHKNHINRAIFCSVTTCCRLLLSIWTWFCCSFVSSGLTGLASSKATLSIRVEIIFVSSQRSIIRRNQAINCHRRPLGVIDLDAEATNSVYPVYENVALVCLIKTHPQYMASYHFYREKSPGELDKNEKDINNSKMQCRLSCLLRFSDFYQKPDWEIEAAAVTITITIRLRFNHILNKLA